MNVLSAERSLAEYDNFRLSRWNINIRYIRSIMSDFRECMQMLATRSWEDSREKRHFESGVHMGVGAFNLVSVRFLPLKQIIYMQITRDAVLLMVA